MTILDDVRIIDDEEPVEPSVDVARPDLPGAASSAEPRPLNLTMTAGAALLSTASAAWLVGGLVRGAVLPKLLALIGASIGVGLIAISARSRRPALVQYLVVPASTLVGAIAISPVATGGTANLAGLVGEAIRNGGLLQPPIPFDPGWRFILVVLHALAGAVALSTALAFRRPKLAVAVPLPLIIGGALLQPDGGEAVAAGVGIALVVGALLLASGADLAADAAGSRAFESRRLLRGLVLMVVLATAIAGLAKTDFLFPAADREQVIPPQKPPASPPEPDRELFKIDTTELGPWRIGVLDVYDGESWLLPPSDPARLVKPARPKLGAKTISFSITDIRGRSLPVPAGVTAVSGPGTIELDPRTEVPRLPSRVPKGYKYSVESAPRPSGSALNAVPLAPADIVDAFILGDGLMPPAPDAVAALFINAPEKSFDRLQFVRDRLYANVIAAGAGSPVPVSPARVAQMLEGPTEATPFEITAAEALLARWAGLPARIGYGYYGGDAVEGGTSYRPRHGSAWLEVYFQGHGWVPLIGTPPQAKPSETNDLQNRDPRVRPSDELGLSLILPVERPETALLFEVVRYWMLALTPLVATGALTIWSLPLLYKSVRSWRRRRWMRGRGPTGRIIVAYAHLRERATDLNLAPPALTPLEFARAFDADAEQSELAWLVTRSLWGDLARDVRPEDAEMAEALAQSVEKRIDAAQPLYQRILATTSRASLRETWTPALPNVVGLPRPRLSIARLRLRPARLLSGRPGATALLIVMALVWSSCVSQQGLGGDTAPSGYPSTIADGTLPSVLGFDFIRESGVEGRYAKSPDRSLVRDGRFYSIRREGSIEGSLQVLRFRAKVSGRSTTIQQQIESSLGGSFTNHRVGTAAVRQRIKREQHLFLWFPPERNILVLLTVRPTLTEGPSLVTAVVGIVRGLPLEALLANPAGLPAGDAGAGSGPPGSGLLRPVEPGKVPDAPTDTGGVTCGSPKFRTTVKAGVERDAAMAVIPPGVAPEGIRAEARLTVRNTGPTEEKFTVTFFADQVGGPTLGSKEIALAPRAAGVASVFWPTEGRRGITRVAYRVSGGGQTIEGAESYAVEARGGAVAERRLRAVWLDPLGLSPGVYARRCPVTEASLRASVDAMADMGATSVIVTYVEYLGAFLYPSTIEFFDRDTGRTSRGQHFKFDVIGTVLSQADRNGLHVFLGLGRSGDTELIGSYGQPDHAERRQHAIDVSTKVADDLWKQYGGHQSLYGWYMTHETTSMKILGPIYDPVARYLDRFGPEKPVLAAPTGNPDISRDEVKASEVDVFAYQDAVGAGYNNRAYTYNPENRMVQLKEHYGRYRANHEGTNKHLWSDLELWEMDGTQGYSGAYPADFSRVRRQLEIEADYVDFVTGYDWSGFMEEPDSAAPLVDRRAVALFTAYQGYRVQ